MAKEFTVSDPSTRTSNNKRFAVSYTLNGKKVTTVGQLHKDEAAAAAFVRRSLSNLGISLPAGSKISVEEVKTR